MINCFITLFLLECFIKILKEKCTLFTGLLMDHIFDTTIFIFMFLWGNKAKLKILPFIQELINFYSKHADITIETLWYRSPKTPRVDILPAWAIGNGQAFDTTLHSRHFTLLLSSPWSIKSNRVFNTE